MVFLYTKDKLTVKKIRETTPCTIVINNINYLGVTLTKQVKYLYDKDLRLWIKKSRKTSEDGKISHAHELAGLI
jgi:hypothetical protein